MPLRCRGKASRPRLARQRASLGVSPVTHPASPLIVLPTREACERAVRDRTFSALQKFVADQEPAGVRREAWRGQLAAVLSEAIANDRHRP